MTCIKYHLEQKMPEKKNVYITHDSIFIEFKEMQTNISKNHISDCVELTGEGESIV